MPGLLRKKSGNTLIKFISRVAVLLVETLKIGFKLNANSKPPRIHLLQFKTMIYTVIPSQQEKCVSLICTGDMTLAEMTTAWGLVQIGLSRFGWKRILIDVTALQSSPDTAELFDLAKLFWRNFPQSGRMALVVRWDQSTRAKLLETLLRSVGVYLTVFVSDEVAEAWILEDSQKHQRSASDLFPKTAAQSDLSKGSLPCHVL